MKYNFRKKNWMVLYVGAYRLKHSQLSFIYFWDIFKLKCILYSTQIVGFSRCMNYYIFINARLLQIFWVTGGKCTDGTYVPVAADG